MGITDVISLLGGLAVFLYGMSTMSDGLEKMSSGRLESILERLTSNIVKGVLLGAFVTAIIQSSSATTVMCVGFVNAGIMKLNQAVGIIMGANIGTTMTAQLLRLGDLTGGGFLLSLLKPSSLGPILAAVGILFYMFINKGGQKRNLGQMALGLGLIFIGMKSMEASVAVLKDSPAFCDLLISFSNPILGVAFGAIFTAIIQSSSASVGILQALSSTGLVTFNIALPLVFGQNIGTCITALLSSVGASRNAKRTAGIHLSFNLIGTIVFLVAFYAGNAFFQFPFWVDVLDRGGIANLHLFFNIAATLLLLPFHNLLVKLVERIVPDSAEQREITVLDERFLASPSLALEKSRECVIRMGNLAQENYRLSVELLGNFDSKKLERIQESEVALDKLQDTLDNYLVKLTDRALTPDESNLISELLHTLSDFERIGDYAMNLSESAVALHSRNITFSAMAKEELDHLTNAVDEALSNALECYEHRSPEVAAQVEPLEEVVDLMRDELKRRHIERLKDGECTIELGTQFLEMLINLERISDHCSNVALYILRQAAPATNLLIQQDAHTYLENLHHGGNQTFDTLYAQYRSKYFAPIESM